MAFDWRRRRVLVTGATGFIGSRLCAELARRGASVAALTRGGTPREDRGGGPTFRPVRGSLTDPRDCARAVAEHEPEIVFHLGAQAIVGAALRDPLACLETNVRGTYNLLEAVRLAGPRAPTCVVASSDKAYGAADALPYVEGTPLRGRLPYDASKRCAELLCASYAATYGAPVVVARCGNVYGGGDLRWSRIVPATMRHVLSGTRQRLRSDGAGLRDYTYVDDVVAAYLALAERGREDGVAGAAFNVSAENRLSTVALVAAIARVAGVDHAPIPGTRRADEIADQTLDCSAARRRLGWRPTWTLEAGLRATLAWYAGYFEARARDRAPRGAAAAALDGAARAAAVGAAGAAIGEKKLAAT